MKIVFKCPVWRTLNFDNQLIFYSLKPTYTDGTEITEKNCSVSQHLLQFLGDKIAKKDQEDPGESLVDINRKLITDDPENNIRNWFSDL